jgi:hypothetical protein
VDLAVAVGVLAVTVAVVVVTSLLLGRSLFFDALGERGLEVCLALRLLLIGSNRFR